MDGNLEKIVVQKLINKFKMSESTANAKLRSKTVQMVIESIVSSSGEIDNEFLSAVQEEKERLETEKERLDAFAKEIEVEKKALQEKEEELDILQKKLTEATTEEAKDRIRLLDVYNSLVFRFNPEKPLSYETYIRGAVSILSGIPMK